MKSRTRIESAVFQLTPTRTRFDLIINADGKVEKMDSGLLDPFLAHLKIARDQFAKGGYSIVLKPNPDSNPTWFTKGTVERFFRFVSSPEVLERVCTIESEILQIEGAISLHKNNDIGLINGEDHQENLVECTEGTKHVLDSNEDKAIVLYQPGLHPPEASGSPPAQEGNSKVQLLRVLETRKTVLQKEQGMAFARAVAAGFDIDHMTPLMSFSECFGAARFMDACLKFMDLWTKKHEAGQWLEIEATDLSSSNALGITPATVTNNQNEINEGFPESLTNLHPEKASVDAGADDKPSTDHEAPNGNKEYVPGQYPHLMFPPWPIHSPPGALPVYQSYPMQGIPYYQNYPGNGPYFPPPYQFVEDPRINASHSQRTRQRRHSMDSRGSNTESDSLEPNDPKTRSLDVKELNKEVSQGRESMKKSSHMGKKNSGMVVIRNINSITSKNHYSSCSESQSASDSETDGDSEFQSADFEQNKSSSKSSKRRANQTMSADALDSFDKEDVIHGKEADGEKWQAFQNCLLRDAGDDRKIIDQGMRTFKREAQVKQRQIKDGADILVLSGQYSQETQEGRKIDCVGDDVLHLRKASKDEVVLSSREGHYGDGRASINGQLNIQSIEEGRRGVYRRTATDDFIIPGQENQSNVVGSSSDLLPVNAFERTSNKLDRSLSHTDESFIVPMRSGSVGQVGLEGRAAIDIAAELPSVVYKPDNHSIRVGTHVNYEPDDLSLMPKHGSEKSSIGFDPALDYEMQAHATGGVGPDDDKDVVTVNDESKKLTRPKVITDSLNKKRITGVPKKGKPSKLSPLDEARARAESLRSFKADLQKVKKEKEEEEMRRLEALKIARQNRISARSGSIPALSPFRPQQTRNQLPKKHHSQGSHGVSKFSDSEPGSLSPLLRVPKRTLSLTSSNSPITSKPSRLNSGSQRGSNRLTHSASSLPEPKKNNEVISPDPKASVARIRRLSEPKLSSSRYTSLKPQTTETVSKRKLSHEPESKKVSAIINLDKSKAATLPGLKIASEGPLEPAKEMTETANGYHSSTTYAGSNQNKKNDNMDHDDTDDNPVIEKTIVILECEKPAARSLQPSEETARVLNGHYDDHTQGGDTVASGYAHIHAPVSEPDLNGTGRKSVDPKLMEQSSSCEVTAEYAEKESPKFSSISMGGKPQQPPIVRVSSLEDPCTDISEHRKAPPTSIEADTAKMCVPDLKNSKLERIPETLEKSQVKESSRGFRRLLKLGRKNHSADGSFIEESNNATNAGASSEVYTLKNLISQDEAGTTSRKASRHFLLSPFLGKNSEKKLMT